jgi:hypothetical protein
MKDYSGLILLVVFLGCVVWAMLVASANDAAYAKRLAETTNQEDGQLQYQVDVMNRLLYFKDQITGLCFAVTGSGRSRTMASVDCNKLGNPIIFWSN